MPQHTPTDQSIMIAKRILVTMREFQKNTQGAHGEKRELAMSAFTALGFALAIVFEECTGISAKNQKPIEVMKWAMDLPTPQRSKVPENMVI